MHLLTLLFINIHLKHIFLDILILTLSLTCTFIQSINPLFCMPLLADTTATPSNTAM